MQNATSWLFYALFALVLLLTYMAIRRRWGPPALVSIFGVIAGIVTMTLMGLAQGNTLAQALFAGFLVGGLFSLGALAMAWYFKTSEARRARYSPADADLYEQPPLDEIS